MEIKLGKLKINGDLIYPVTLVDGVYDSDARQSLKTTLSEKATKSELNAHTGNSVIHVTQSNKDAWTAKYDKPASGIPYEDLSSGVQESLDKAESAIQDISMKEDKANKVPNNINSENIDSEILYPSVKATVGYVSGVRSELETEIGFKADQDDFLAHTGDTDIHTNPSEKAVWTAKYDKPSTGIPKSDLEADVKASLEKADNSVQKNPEITSATKCKITYDSKGLVTSGTNLDPNDIPSGVPIAKIEDLQTVLDSKVPKTIAEEATTSDKLIKESTLTAAIEDLDVAAIGESGKYIEKVSETDGKISAVLAPLPTYQIKANQNPGSGNLASYYLEKTVGDTTSQAGIVINIPSEKIIIAAGVIQYLGGSKITINGVEYDVQGTHPNGTYIVMIVSNSDQIWIPSISFVYTSGSDPAVDPVVIEVSTDNKITAYLGDGRIAKTKLTQALQDEITGKEDKVNKVTSISESSTDTQYPSAKAVYDTIIEDEEIISTALNDLETRKEDKSNKVTSWGETPSDTNYPSEKLVKTEMGKYLPLTGGTLTGNLDLYPSESGDKRRLTLYEYPDDSQEYPFSRIYPSGIGTNLNGESLPEGDEYAHFLLFPNKTGTLAVTSDFEGKEDKANKVTSISGSSTDTQYPSAKAVWNLVGSESPYTEITWSSLKELRDSEDLKPGNWYRITDYGCTTIQEDTQSANHSFDIIVRADSESTLNENAYAALHEGDTYFADCNLEAWELKYCLDNNDHRFSWADPTGKGVIYYMKDEWDNECPYDFKNIQFKRWKVTSDIIGLGGRYVGILDSDQPGIEIEDENDSIWCYTLGYLDEDTVMRDLSLNQLAPDGISDYGGCSHLCHSNTISNKSTFISIDDEDIQAFDLTNIVMFGYYDADSMESVGRGDFSLIYGNHFGEQCSSITGMGKFYSNTFGNNCFSITFGNNCSYNTFGNNCSNNTFGKYCSNNTTDDNCYYNTFGNSCSDNTFSNYCYNNTFGNNCSYNTFGSDCNNNTFGSDCNSNAFGSDCNSNTLGNECSSNTLGSNCDSNIFGNNCSYNIFGNNCDSNTFGNNCYFNFFYSGCSYIIFGNNCSYNTFGSDCTYNTFGSSASSTKNYYHHITYENGVQYTLLNCTAATSSSAYCQNIHVNSGVKGSSGSSRKTLTVETAGNNFTTEFGMNSAGELKSWNPADLIN